MNYPSLVPVPGKYPSVVLTAPMVKKIEIEAHSGLTFITLYQEETEVIVAASVSHCLSGYGGETSDTWIGPRAPSKLILDITNVVSRFSEEDQERLLTSEKYVDVSRILEQAVLSKTEMLGVRSEATIMKTTVPNGYMHIHLLEDSHFLLAIKEHRVWLPTVEVVTGEWLVRYLKGIHGTKWLPFSLKDLFLAHIKTLIEVEEEKRRAWSMQHKSWT